MMKEEQQSRHDDVHLDYRCERCWSSKNINLYQKSLFTGNNGGFVILCDRCRSEAPEGQSEVFNNLFLRFASTKEFIQHYKAKNEAEAIELWCIERGLERSLVEEKTEITPQAALNVESLDRKAPIGYELREGKFTVKREEARIVQSIFESYLSGRTMERIARTIGQEKQLGIGAVRAILKDPIYAGYVFRGKELVKVEHEPIIDKNTYNNVQQRIVRNIRNPRYRYKPLILGE